MTAFPPSLTRLLRDRLIDPARPPEGTPAHSDWDLTGGRPPVVSTALKPAAVLMALVARPIGPSLILTRRTDDMPTHAGQVALPGGRAQPEDPHLAATALREAHEEVGLDPAEVEVIGLADSWHSVTSYAITPVLGLVHGQPALRRDPREVAEVFEVPFAFLMDPANHIRETRHWNGQDRHYWTMPWGGHHIWGATAGMLRALNQRLFDGRAMADVLEDQSA